MQIGACPPIDTNPADFVGLKRVENCTNSRGLISKEIRDYSVVIVSANWPAYQARSNRFLDEFFDTTRSLANEGRLVIILGKAPIISGYDRLCREKQISYPYISCKIPDVPMVKEVAEINEQLEAFSAKHKNIEYYDFNEYLCPNDSCSLYDEFGNVMYYNSSHLSLPASWRIGKDIVRREGVPYPFSKVPGLLNATSSTPHRQIDASSHEAL